MTVAALNYKPFDKGAIRGFLDLRYHGLTIKGVRLMFGEQWPVVGLSPAERRA
jgi:hypothetical protein